MISQKAAPEGTAIAAQGRRDSGDHESAGHCADGGEEVDAGCSETELLGEGEAGDQGDLGARRCIKERAN